MPKGIPKAGYRVHAPGANKGGRPPLPPEKKKELWRVHVTPAEHKLLRERLAEIRADPGATAERDDDNADTIR